MPAIHVGDRAPRVTAEAHDGRQVTLDDLVGERAIVLFFYPRDGTPVCTAEACSFRDAYEQFIAAGATVVGVSADSAASHRRFSTNQRLPFVLLSDSSGVLRRAFGVPKTLGIFPGRVTYVIDRQGIVRHVFNAQFTAQGHVDQALRIVRQLATEPAAAHPAALDGEQSP